MDSITKEKVTDLLREMIDPEMGVNVVDLGCSVSSGSVKGICT